jgi:Leu/Phe-tRNA-protein transferase
MYPKENVFVTEQMVLAKENASKMVIFQMNNALIAKIDIILDLPAAKTNALLIVLRTFVVKTMAIVKDVKQVFGIKSASQVVMNYAEILVCK